MKIISWNVKGLGYPKKIPLLKISSVIINPILLCYRNSRNRGSIRCVSALSGVVGIKTGCSLQLRVNWWYVHRLEK